MSLEAAYSKIKAKRNTDSKKINDDICRTVSIKSLAINSPTLSCIGIWLKPMLGYFTSCWQLLGIDDLCSKFLRWCFFHASPYHWESTPRRNTERLIPWNWIKKEGLHLSRYLIKEPICSIGYTTKNWKIIRIGEGASKKSGGLENSQHG